MTNTADIFLSFQKHIDEEQDIREEIRVTCRELEQTARSILIALQGMHQDNGIKQIPTLCQTARESFSTVQSQYAVLANKIPSGQYYRFHYHWRFVTQRLAFLGSLLVYLETEQMATIQQLVALLGVKETKEEGFHLDLDDYLSGLLQMASELSRLAVNSTTAKDYARPVRIARFLNDLNSGFRLLNLKNDTLRKRFDGLKYDLKKVEEVVYDLSIRGLKPDMHGDVKETT